MPCGPDRRMERGRHASLNVLYTHSFGHDPFFFFAFDMQSFVSMTFIIFFFFSLFLLILYFWVLHTRSWVSWTCFLLRFVIPHVVPPFVSQKQEPTWCCWKGRLRKHPFRFATLPFSVLEIWLSVPFRLHSAKRGALRLRASRHQRDSNSRR